MAMVAVPIAAAVGAWWWRRPGGADEEDSPPIEGESPQLISKPKGKEEAASEGGYYFGDLYNGVVRRWTGSGEGEEFDAAGELDKQIALHQKTEAAEARMDRVETLVRDAVVLYRARGYKGTITISQRVGVFTESASIDVKPPAEDEAGASPPPSAPPAAGAAAEGDSRAGRAFETLFARLEKRAVNWGRLSGVEGLDPLLSESAQIGFAVPVVNIGWGVSVTFSVSRSTLMRWVEAQAGAGAPASA